MGTTKSYKLHFRSSVMKPGLSRPIISGPFRTFTTATLFITIASGNLKRPFFMPDSGLKSKSQPRKANICFTTATEGSSYSHINVANPNSTPKLEAIEADIEKLIYRCRFLALLGVFGSLVGSFICFVKGCTFVVASFKEYLINRSKVILLLVEAIDVYLLGTVMMVFGMGLYELFVSNLDTAKSLSKENASSRSSLFGLFTLKERPRWLAIKSVNELKTKLGHVIVMLLLINLFDKSKKAAIHTPFDLLCFSASILLSSGCLYLLSKLND